MAPILTVDNLLSLLKKLHESGNGDMKIKCRDNFLHEDEIGINYMNNEMMFIGLIFNHPMTQNVKEFCNDIDKAEKKFYGFINGEESEEK